jgi:hypothetical protein
MDETGVRNSESTPFARGESAQARRSAATPARSAPSTVAPTIPSRAPVAPPLDVEALIGEEAATRGPLHGTVSFFAVRLTGAGADAAVKLVLRPDAIKTGPPPAPTADVFGAVKGT